ncbi:MAG: hypothetical protein ACJ75T_07425 [Solirubrobacterales bacterium]
MAFPLELANLETAVLEACAGEDVWPAQVAAAIYAGVDYAIAHPEVAETLAYDSAAEDESVRRYESVIARLAGFLRVKAPSHGRLPVATDETLMAGMVGLVGDHLRVGRLDRLAQLRPELVLLTLLPYLGFDEAQEWANRTAG